MNAARLRFPPGSSVMAALCGELEPPRFSMHSDDHFCWAGAAPIGLTGQFKFLGILNTKVTYRHRLKMLPRKDRIPYILTAHFATDDAG